MISGFVVGFLSALVFFPVVQILIKKLKQKADEKIH